ncbi:MAG: hypothetical protein JSS49_16400 [Planctomycetes bacterium]|nr:hypothetical protein [Planctomycetota bacterium]
MAIAGVDAQDRVFIRVARPSLEPRTERDWYARLGVGPQVPRAPVEVEIFIGFQQGDQFDGSLVRQARRHTDGRNPDTRKVEGDSGFSCHY